MNISPFPFRLSPFTFYLSSTPSRLLLDSFSTHFRLIFGSSSNAHQMLPQTYPKDTPRIQPYFLHIYALYYIYVVYILFDAFFPF